MVLWKGLCGAALGVGMCGGGLGPHVCCRHSSSSHGVNGPCWVGSGSYSRPSQGSGTVCISSCWLPAPSAGPALRTGSDTGTRGCLSALRLWQPLPTACGRSHMGSCRVPSVSREGILQRICSGCPGRLTLEERTGEGVPTTATTTLNSDTAPVSADRGCVSSIGQETL